MHLIILIGSGAVGKMTVGQELMKITDYRLFHNHHMIEPVIEIFGRFDGAVISKLREDIFDAFIVVSFWIFPDIFLNFLWKNRKECAMLLKYVPKWPFALQKRRLGMLSEDLGQV